MAVAQSAVPTIEDQLLISLDSMRIVNAKTTADIDQLKHGQHYVMLGISLTSLALCFEQCMTALDMKHINQSLRSESLENAERKHYIVAGVAFLAFVMAGRAAFQAGQK